MSEYYGDIRLGDTIDIPFTTRRFSTGVPHTLAGSPVISAFIGNSTSPITAGITLTVDHAGTAGANNVRIVTSTANGFTPSTNVALRITTGTVDSVSVVGEVVGSFSIQNRYDVTVYAKGVADSGSQLQLVDAERTEPNGGYFLNSQLLMTSGTNAGQTRPFFSFSAASDTYVLSEGFQNSIATGEHYAILNNMGSNVNLWGSNYVGSAVNGLVPAIIAATDSNGIARTGTAQSGSTTGMVDSTKAGAGTNWYVGWKIRWTSGSLSGHESLVKTYDTATGTFGFAEALPTAVTTNTYCFVSSSMNNSNVTQWLHLGVEALLNDASLRAALGLSSANLDDRLLSTTAAVTQNKLLEKIITVDSSTLAPSTTVFETTSTTGSLAQYVDAVLTTRTGANATNISRQIIGWASTNGKDRLTLDAPLPTAPTNTDTFTLMGYIQ